MKLVFQPASPVQQVSGTHPRGHPGQHPSYRPAATWSAQVEAAPHGQPSRPDLWGCLQPRHQWNRLLQRKLLLLESPGSHLPLGAPAPSLTSSRRSCRSRVASVPSGRRQTLAPLPPRREQAFATQPGAPSCLRRLQQRRLHLPPRASPPRTSGLPAPWPGPPGPGTQALPGARASPSRAPSSKALPSPGARQGTRYLAGSLEPAADPLAHQASFGASPRPHPSLRG